MNLFSCLSSRIGWKPPSFFWTKNFCWIVFLRTEHNYQWRKSWRAEKRMSQDTEDVFSININCRLMHQEKSTMKNVQVNPIIKVWTLRHELPYILWRLSGFVYFSEHLCLSETNSLETIWQTTTARCLCCWKQGPLVLQIVLAKTSPKCWDEEHFCQKHMHMKRNYMN